MRLGLLIAALLSTDAPQVFKSADGNQWTVTRLPANNPLGDDRILKVERLGRDGGSEVFEFEETFMNGQKAIRYKRVEFSLDANGVFQALETWTTESRRGKKPNQVTKVVQKWNGKAFAGAETP